MPPDETVERPSNFDGTLEHAKAGYANAQDIIKFIDTKIGVMTGLITVSLGFPFLVIQWMAEQGDDSLLSLGALGDRSPIWAMSSAAAVIVGSGAGLFALYLALQGLVARSPAPRSGVVILFPMFKPFKNEREAKTSFERLQRGLNPAEILREYEVQLYQVGQILYLKATNLRRSVRFFAGQVFTYFIALAFLLLGRAF